MASPFHHPGRVKPQLSCMLPLVALLTFNPLLALVVMPAHAQDRRDLEARPVARPIIPDRASFIEIDAPDLTIIARPVSVEITIDAPNLVIAAKPVSQDIVINAPDLTIVARPVPEEITIEVPDLIIVTKPAPRDIVIDVPDLTVVAKRDEEPDAPLSSELTVATGKTTANQPDTPSATDTVTSPDTDPDPQGIAQWCVGDFDAHIGRGVGTAVGFAMPFGDYMVSDSRVTAQDCRNTLAFNVQGQTVLLSQGETPRSYSGGLDFGDGAMRTLVLQCDEDLNLRGRLVTADQNLRIERPVWLIRKPQSPADITDCSSLLTKD